MQYTHIHKSDLNLLINLQVIIEEGSISRAARRMFVSQSAMSRILDRLQSMFNDELLIKTAKGYEPTPRGIVIIGELQELLPKVELLLRGRQFDPAISTEEFRVASTNFASIRVFPKLLDRLMREAPKVRIHLSSWENGFRRLDSNSVDLVLTAYPPEPHLRSELLIREPFVCVVGKNHPIRKRRLTVDEYLKYPHVSSIIDPARQQIIDSILEKLGKKRDLQLTVPQAFVASILERSTMIATVPQGSAERYIKTSATRVVQAPRQFGVFSYQQVWHPRTEEDVAQKWLRNMIRNVCGLTH